MSSLSECYLLCCHPTGQRALTPLKQAVVLDLHTPQRWKTELTLVLVKYRDGLPAADSYPSRQ